MSMLYALVEGGGTKFNCAVSDERGNILKRIQIPTTTPHQTLSSVVEFFDAQQLGNQRISRMGVACFGPLDLNVYSVTFGQITSTPKPGWKNTALHAYFSKQLGCEVVLDTDVNGAALGEYRWGASINTTCSVYVTVGTGIGGGVVINGIPLHGLVHPEIGHMLIPPREGITGVCPFHTHCVEGYASGTAMGKIWQMPADKLEDNQQAREYLAGCLADMCHNLLLTLSPQRIVLGGGVMNMKGLLTDVVQRTENSLQGYITLPEGVKYQDIIVPPKLGNDAGLYGALALIDEGKIAQLP